jgi:hypothetical protein
MFQQLLETIAKSLDKADIPYMVIGGQAVLLYGEPRLTKDIDVTLGIGLERVSDVLNLISELGWEVLVDSPEQFVKKTMVLPCREPVSGIRVDLIFSFSLFERQAIERARLVPMGKTAVRFASIEDLIIHKIIAGRPRDLEDVKILINKSPGLDAHYIQSWLARFEESLSQPYVHQFVALMNQSQ